MIGNIVRSIRILFEQRVNRVNEAFNKVPVKRKKRIILFFGLCTSWISISLIIQALHPQENTKIIQTERLLMPYDIFMKEEQTISETHLVPVGKMKGEIDGEFESFYVAVDNQGQVYINRDIEYSQNAYTKTEDWKQISREKLSEYERELHFIPNRSQGIKR